ncbi:aspartyl aminopeptidase [Paraburkholderia sp. 35.1]
MTPASKQNELEELSLDAAARVLGVPRIVVRKLVEDNVLPSRIVKTGYRQILRIPTVAVHAHREKMRAIHNAGLRRQMDIGACGPLRRRE